MGANRADFKGVILALQQTGDAHVSQVAFHSCDAVRKKSGCPMSKLLAILATLKAILIAASVAFARGDMLPVILISILLNLTQLGAKPIGQAVLRDPVASPPSQDRNR
jgi:Na+/H+-dicarboxylate symporter